MHVMVFSCLFEVNRRCIQLLEHRYRRRFSEKRGKGEKSKSEKKTPKTSRSIYCRLRNTL
jgi:hypothetical protein